MYKFNWISEMFRKNVKNSRMDFVMNIVNHVEMRKELKGNDLEN